MNTIDPSKIMQIGMGFWASKTLLTAVNMNLFTHLATGEKSGQQIQQLLGLHERSLYDFLDTLVALGFLQRSGLKENSNYSNMPDVNLFLDKNKPTYIGGILEMSNNRLYPFWNNLEEALKTGKAQNESKSGEAPLFEAIYSDENRLREFLHAMGGVQAGNFDFFARNFDFSGFNSHCDIGGSGGNLSVHIAKNNKHIKSLSFDLPPVAPIAESNFKALGLDDRIKAVAGDFFKDDLPKAQLITMSNVLHDWGPKDKKMLVQKAYDALPDNGTLVVIENIIDNDRSKNAFGLMMSLNMLIETDEGSDYTLTDFEEWAREAGFKKISIMPLTGPASAIIASK
jgi:predicted O-methyltransferase YrrM